MLGGEREDAVLEEGVQDGREVAAVDAGDGDGELWVVESVEADVDGVFEAVGEEEKGCCVFCTLSVLAYVYM